MVSVAQKNESHNSPIGKIVRLLTGSVVALVLVIGTVSFILSFDALQDVASANGLGPKSWLFPWLVDLPLLVFTIALLVAQLTGQRLRFWVGLVGVYTAGTIFFNVSHAAPTWLGWVVAIVPPVGLLLSTEALRSLAKTIIETTAAVTTLANLRTQAEAEARRRDDLRTEAEDLAGKVEKVKAELKDLRKEKREAGRNPAEVSEDTTEAALMILAERPDITGSDLGRTLGKSPSLGRRLKRELLPLATANGHQNGNGNGRD